MNEKFIPKQELAEQEGQFSIEGLLQVVKESHKEVSVVNPNKKVSCSDFKLLFTLCPLYAPGPLNESGAIVNPQTIEESRVGGKWSAIQVILKAMKSYLEQHNGKLNTQVIFANRGVLLAHKPSQEDEQALTNHDWLYRKEISKLCEENSIECRYKTYDDLDVKLPRFVNPKSSIPGLESGEVEKIIFTQPQGVVRSILPQVIIPRLNALMEDFGVPSKVKDNRESEGVIRHLLSMQGIDYRGCFWLTAGYLAFDYKIPDLAGNNGVYMAIERFDPIFDISRLTPELNTMTRFNVKA